MVDVSADNFRRLVPVTDSSGEVAHLNTILRCIVGSQLYGTSIGGSDKDEMGVFIEPPSHIFGFKKLDTWTSGGKEFGVKSDENTVDVTLYSLRQYVSLAMQGNPSVLQLLFAPKKFILPDTNHFGLSLMQMWPDIVSKRAYPRFRGYLQSQKLRLMGEKRGHVPSRPELIEQHGYDTKYAMHAMRLGLQGIELLEKGWLDLPMNEAEDLVAVRQGYFSYDEAIWAISCLEKNLEKALEKSLLPDEPNYSAMEKWIISTHLNDWKYKGYV